MPADDTCSHLIGCVYVDAVLDVFQGLVQVARTGGPEKTVACICLQPGRKKERRRGEGGKDGRKGGKKEGGIEERKEGRNRGIRKECTTSRGVEKETEGLD